MRLKINLIGSGSGTCVQSYAGSSKNCKNVHFKKCIVIQLLKTKTFKVWGDRFRQLVLKDWNKELLKNFNLQFMKGSGAQTLKSYQNKNSK